MTGKEIKTAVKTIGEPDSERINFVMERLSATASLYNCTTVALYLLGLTEEDANILRDRPMGGLWMNLSKMVFFKNDPKGYELFKGVDKKKDLEGKQGYIVYPPGSGFSISFGDEILGPTGFYAASESKKPIHDFIVDPFNQLEDEKAKFWNHLSKLLNDKRVVSLLSYKYRYPQVRIYQFHHATLLKNKGAYFVVEKMGPKEPLTVKSLSKSTFFEALNQYREGIHFLAVDGIGLPN